MQHDQVMRVLNDPLAQELINSSLPARVAYTARDATPRVVPLGLPLERCGVHRSDPTPAVAASPRLRPETINRLRSDDGPAHAGVGVARDRRGAATRERILDAAAALMRARGPAGASTRAIARAANLTEAALYRHFSSKEELLGYVLAERMPQFLDVIKDLPNRVGQSSVQNTLEEFARAAVAFYEQLAPMLASIGSDPALLAQQQASLRDSGLGPHLANRSLAAYLRAEQAQARLTPEVDADAAATLLLGACFEQGFFRHLYGRDVLLPASDRFAPALVEALLHGAGTESAR